MTTDTRNARLDGAIKEIDVAIERSRKTPPGALRGPVIELACLLETHWPLIRAALPTPNELENHVEDSGQEQVTPRSSTAGAWRSIESAPKDGSDVLLVGDTDETGERFWAVASWDDYRQSWCPWWHTQYGVDQTVRHDWPTHWMPLPSPPAVEERDGTDSTRDSQRGSPNAPNTGERNEILEGAAQHFDNLPRCTLWNDTAAAMVRALKENIVK